MWSGALEVGVPVFFVFNFGKTKSLAFLRTIVCKDAFFCTFVHTKFRDMYQTKEIKLSELQSNIGQINGLKTAKNGKTERRKRTVPAW